MVPMWYWYFWATPTKTNMEPRNEGLENVFFCEQVIFRLHVSVRGWTPIFGTMTMTMTYNDLCIRGKVMTISFSCVIFMPAYIAPPSKSYNIHGIGYTEKKLIHWQVSLRYPLYITTTLNPKFAAKCSSPELNPKHLHPPPHPNHSEARYW